MTKVVPITKSTTSNECNKCMISCCIGSFRKVFVLEKQRTISINRSNWNWSNLIKFEVYFILACSHWARYTTKSSLKSLCNTGLGRLIVHPWEMLHTFYLPASNCYKIIYALIMWNICDQRDDHRKYVKTFSEHPVMIAYMVKYHGRGNALKSF